MNWNRFFIMLSLFAAISQAAFAQPWDAEDQADNGSADYLDLSIDNGDNGGFGYAPWSVNIPGSGSITIRDATAFGVTSDINSPPMASGVAFYAIAPTGIDTVQGIRPFGLTPDADTIVQVDVVNPTGGYAAVAVEDVSGFSGTLIVDNSGGTNWSVLSFTTNINEDTGILATTPIRILWKAQGVNTTWLVEIRDLATGAVLHTSAVENYTFPPDSFYTFQFGVSELYFNRLYFDLSGSLPVEVSAFNLE